MTDKDNMDTHHVSTPKAEEIFSHPNKLNELLDDLESYEMRDTKTLLFNSDKGGRMEKVPYKPAKPLPETYKDTTNDKDIPMANIRNNQGMNVEKEVSKELEKAHEDAPFAAVTNLPEVYKKEKGKPIGADTNLPVNMPEEVIAALDYLNYLDKTGKG